MDPACEPHDLCDEIGAISETDSNLKPLLDIFKQMRDHESRRCNGPGGREEWERQENWHVLGDFPLEKLSCTSRRPEPLRHTRVTPRALCGKRTRDNSS